MKDMDSLKLKYDCGIVISVAFGMLYPCECLIIFGDSMFLYNTRRSVFLRFSNDLEILNTYIIMDVDAQLILKDDIKHQNLNFIS